MKLYSAALVAWTGYRCEALAAAVVAPDQPTALGLALNLCREGRPAADGWRSHSADVFEVPADTIRKVADA